MHKQRQAAAGPWKSTNTGRSSFFFVRAIVAMGLCSTGDASEHTAMLQAGLQMGAQNSIDVSRLADSQPVMSKPYPFEYLLDEDYIHNSGNPLDNWPPSTTPPPTTTTTTQTTTTKKGTTPAPSPAPTTARATRPPQGCVTVEPRRAAWFAKTAKAGSRCVFGADPRDEGDHCILDDPSRHGSFGWCWTKEDRSEWGSCGADCPLFGQEAKLRDKLLKAQATLTAWKAELAKNREGSQPGAAAVAAQLTAEIGELVGPEPTSQAPHQSAEPVVMEVANVSKELFPAVLALPAVASAALRLVTGASVELAINFTKFSDAKKGPLVPGEHAQIKKVSARGRCLVQNWWYDGAALRAATSSPPAGTLSKAEAVASLPETARLHLPPTASVSAPVSAAVSSRGSTPVAGAASALTRTSSSLSGTSASERSAAVHRRHMETVTIIEDLPIGSFIQLTTQSSPH